MKVVKLNISITSVRKDEINCTVSDSSQSINLKYVAPERSIVFEENHCTLTKVISKFQFQFEKVINSALSGNLKVGQQINCVFIDDFRFVSESDFIHKCIQVNRKNQKLKISVLDEPSSQTHKIFADGSYVENTGQSGFAGFIEDPAGHQEIFCHSHSIGSSNLMELLAVIKGLELLKHIDHIQINTDSRFVIRGMVQWIHFWKHNNWQTAHGKSVKFAEHWQYIDALCEGKNIEFCWIKGHSGHSKQSFCHDLAKEITNSKNIQP